MRTISIREYNNEILKSGSKPKMLYFNKNNTVTIFEKNDEPIYRELQKELQGLPEDKRRITLSNQIIEALKKQAKENKYEKPPKESENEKPLKETKGENLDWKEDLLLQLSDQKANTFTIKKVLREVIKRI